MPQKCWGDSVRAGWSGDAGVTALELQAAVNPGPIGFPCRDCRSVRRSQRTKCQGPSHVTCHSVLARITDALWRPGPSPGPTLTPWFESTGPGCGRDEARAPAAAALRMRPRRREAGVPVCRDSYRDRHGDAPVPAPLAPGPGIPGPAQPGHSVTSTVTRSTEACALRFQLESAWQA